MSQQAKQRFGVYQKACFQGKEGEIHIHQRAFKVVVGDPFTQYWCIDFGLLFEANPRAKIARLRFFAAGDAKNPGISATERLRGPLAAAVVAVILRYELCAAKVCGSVDLLRGRSSKSKPGRKRANVGGSASEIWGGARRKRKGVWMKQRACLAEACQQDLKSYSGGTSAERNCPEKL